LDECNKKRKANIADTNRPKKRKRLQKLKNLSEKSVYCEYFEKKVVTEQNEVFTYLQTTSDNDTNALFHALVFVIAKRNDLKKHEYKDHKQIRKSICDKMYQSVNDSWFIKGVIKVSQKNRKKKLMTRLCMLIANREKRTKKQLLGSKTVVRPRYGLFKIAEK